jgi:hypothetical protein
VYPVLTSTCMMLAGDLVQWLFPLHVCVCVMTHVCPCTHVKQRGLMHLAFLLVPAHLGSKVWAVAIAVETKCQENKTFGSKSSPNKKQAKRGTHAIIITQQSLVYMEPLAEV